MVIFLTAKWVFGQSNTPMSGSRLRIRDLNFIIEEKKTTLLRWVAGRFYVVRREKSIDRRLSN
jgi:hypothetical protein